MVSRIRFWSFKGTGEGGAKADRIPFYALFLVPVVIAVLAMDLPRALLAIGVVYAFSGPGFWLWRRWRRAPEATL
jgi:CDP-diacylglycerol--serine O-phosphatidyltransferase